MVIQKIWEKYSYVILLLVITLVCGLIYINALTQNANSVEESGTIDDAQYVYEYSNIEE
ncbi:hypothetical protein OEV98_00145 [Caldibacillus lycopersici]|uniref:Uncharacterized protein n=1 Tax=Perspicuibacillus lycopersici TaxID=1325689 RepID=A0AAE3LL48_9BACI|nr:hypothetical protein [Perspicuibacillus lycopersici]MCU9611965.1 hypothetical protein [Perspicuibacillus lycopersici]